MSFVRVVPDIVAAAAGNLEGIGSAVNAANAAAATPTTGLAAMAADEVSAAVTAVFATHAQQYQALSAQAAAFHEQFVSTLNGGLGAYVRTEFANAEQNLLEAVNAPALALLGHPLIPTGGAAASSGAAPVSAATEPFSLPVVNQATPLGTVALILNGTVDSTTLQVVINSGSIALPTPVALGIDAVSPFYLALTALQNSSTAFTTAVHSGNLLGAAHAFFTAPCNVANSFLFGHGAISQSFPAPVGSGYDSFGFSVPVGGLFTSPQPFTVGLTPTGGTPTSIALSGTQVGGLVPALLGLIGF
jgi:hypothetical protein